ncbi:hypothetical protein EB052_01515 [bacterium]|nr:hypothetical protein [bacterium]
MQLVVKFAEKAISYFAGIALVILCLTAFALFVIIFREEGVMGVTSTLKNEVLRGTLSFVPILALFFGIMGAVSHLQKRHPDEFKDIMEGKRGTTLMVILAAAMPGPAGGEQLQSAWNSKINRTNTILCLTSMMALGMNTILFRAKVLGGPLTLIWIGIAFSIFLQVWLVCKLKPWTWFG